jgi:AbrB family looped-hinge helix DNA binding protein
MKEVLVPIDGAGRLVLPKDVRDELSFNPGDLLRVAIHGDEVTLRPKRETAGFFRKGRDLVFSSGGEGLLQRETVEAILAEEREGGGVRAMRGLPKRRCKR